MKSNKVTDWFNEVRSVPNPWEETKPKLTNTEIQKAAEVYKSFVDPKNQSPLYHIIKNKCHKETYNAWWRIVCGHNRNAVDHPYTVEQYIQDKELKCPNAPCYCGACAC